MERVSGTGSDRTVYCRFRMRKDNGRDDTCSDSDNVWAFEASGLSKGSFVPVVYDPKWPSRHHLGSRTKSWGEHGIMNYVKQFFYAAVMACLGLLWAALTGTGSKSRSR